MKDSLSFGCPEGIHPEAGRGRDSGGGVLPAGRDRPGRLLRFADRRFNWKTKDEGLPPADVHGETYMLSHRSSRRLCAWVTPRPAPLTLRERPPFRHAR